MFEDEGLDESKIFKQDFYNWITIAFEDYYEVMPTLRDI